MDEVVTILTPTYNRAEKLNDLYQSLLRQTNSGFKWMIIDDGSSDRTEETVRRLMAAPSDFRITYLKKPNGGKHTALNVGFQKIDTFLTFIVDSDDVLTENAIEEVRKHIKTIRDKNLCGVAFLRGYSKDRRVGDEFPINEAVGNDIDLRCRKGVRGDKAEVFRTDILKRYRFPVFEGERFQGENYVWWQIAREYDMLYVNKIIYIAEYLDDGLTKAGRALRLRNPLGGMKNCQQAFFPVFPLKTRVKNAILYDVYGYQAGWTLAKIIKESGYPAMTALSALPAKALNLYWTKKYLRP